MGYGESYSLLEACSMETGCGPGNENVRNFGDAYPFNVLAV